MKFKLEIKCDNAAFDGEHRALEIARILEDAASKVECDGANVGDSWKLFDINGNRVGEAKVTK